MTSQIMCIPPGQAFLIFFVESEVPKNQRIFPKSDLVSIGDASVISMILGEALSLYFGNSRLQFLR